MEIKEPFERKNCQILVLDDDGAVRDMLVRVLNEDGYSVWPAADGEEALKIAAAMQFDLALLDLGLPGRGGWEMFKRLTLQNPLLAVIVITAKPNQRDIARSLGAGALFEKPLDFPLLLRTVAQLLAESPKAVRPDVAGAGKPLMIEPNHVSQPRRPRTAGWAVALILAAAVLWFYGEHGRASAGAAKSKPAPRVPVSVTIARSGDIDVALNALGTVTPVSTVTITSRVAGVLQEVHYREGQTVKQGDLLAVIDPRPYQAAVVQAEGQVARDRALLKNARIDADRYRTAFQKHAIPEQEVATQESIVQQDEGVVQIDQGTLEAAQVDLDYTRITSPIDGRVGLRLVDAGNNVAANGTTGLVMITQLQPITVIFTLAQDDLTGVIRAMRRGQPLQVEAFDRKGQRPIAQGKLLTIDNQVDPATGTFRLKGVFPNEDEALWPGEFVNILLVTGVRHNAVTVPARAVQEGPDGNYLYVVKPDDTVELRTVEVSQVSQGLSVIGRGLAAGESVVLDGQYRLESGTRIVRQAASPVTGG